MSSKDPTVKKQPKPPGAPVGPTCSYSRAKCFYPPIANSPLCQLHMCPCGGEKSSQWNTCGNCSKPVKCANKQQTCNANAQKPYNYCPAHRCPVCSENKLDTSQLCDQCNQGPSKSRIYRRCQHISRTGEPDTCNQIPFGDTKFCVYHTCRICGNDKETAVSRCVNCTTKCCLCFGETHPKEEICGTCKALNEEHTVTPAMRSNYVFAQTSDAKAEQTEKWLFVWDFDQTITQKHASNDAPNQAETNIIANLVDVDFFRWITTKLHDDGHFTKMATYADGSRSVQVVYDYLNVVFGPNEQRKFFRNEGVEAFQPIRHGLWNQEGKNIHIMNLLSQIYRKGIFVPLEHVVLFDDSTFNVKKAQERKHRGYICTNGFTPQVWMNFVGEVQNDPSAQYFVAMTNEYLQTQHAAAAAANSAVAGTAVSQQTVAKDASPATVARDMGNMQLGGQQQPPTTSPTEGGAVRDDQQRKASTSGLSSGGSAVGGSGSGSRVSAFTSASHQGTAMRHLSSSSNPSQPTIVKGMAHGTAMKSPSSVSPSSSSSSSTQQAPTSVKQIPKTH